VEGLNLRLNVSETLGCVGETGAGKTTMALGIMGLIPSPPGRVSGGKILFEGGNLLELDEDRMNAVRGGKIAMIFQDPMSSLNPVMTVEAQIAEMISLHTSLKGQNAVRKARELLELVGIRAERGTDYPHQFSGGMKQRVIIAIALACNPTLLIADEPTTALDVTIQAQVLEMMKDLKERLKTSMILITHDLGVVADCCDSVAIMYAGRIVEYGPVRELFTNPLHPYTLGLFGSLPPLRGPKADLRTIPGLMPDPTNLPKGCPFHPRCVYAAEPCSVEPPAMRTVRGNCQVACHVRARPSETEAEGNAS
jgi:peptide/nickel transport system ATP-binding protein